MTVIAWDGRSIAADRRMSNDGLISTATKLRRVKRENHIPEILAYTGNLDSGLMLADWYERGAEPAAWPECQKDKDQWAILVVACSLGLKYYERWPVAIKVEDRLAAFGSGRDFALAAMHLGKSAAEAVEVASVFERGCGNGVDCVEL